MKAPIAYLEPLLLFLVLAVWTCLVLPVQIIYIVSKSTLLMVISFFIILVPSLFIGARSL